MSYTAYYERVVQEDISTGTGTTTIRNPGGGTLTGTQVGIHTFAVTQLKTTSSWTPGTVTTYATKDVTVTGAALGDFALASFSLDVQDLVLSCAVTAANTVTVTLANNTGAAVNLASGTVAVLVFKSA